MSKHTPEPWKLNNKSGQNDVDDSFGRLLAMVYPCEDTLKEMQKANAARIVACVNACAGMENPEVEIQKLKAELSIANHAYNEMALSQTVMSDSLKDAKDEIEQLRADRQRLIEALTISNNFVTVHRFRIHNEKLLTEIEAANV